MPPPFGTGSPSSTTRGLYSLLENGPEQWASTTQQATTPPNRAMPPKCRLEPCCPIRPPRPATACGSATGIAGAAAPWPRTDCARLVGRNLPCPEHIAVGSRQEWGCWARSEETSTAWSGKPPPAAALSRKGFPARWQTRHSTADKPPFERQDMPKHRHVTGLQSARRERAYLTLLPPKSGEAGYAGGRKNLGDQPYGPTAAGPRGPIPICASLAVRR